MILLFSPILVASTLLPNTSYKDPNYPIVGYSGSRVLETNYTVYNTSKMNWTNQATIDSSGNQWIVDQARHIVVLINSKDESLPFLAYGDIVAGTPGKAGYLDGGNAIALFNSPTGIAVFNQSVFISDTANQCIRRIDLNMQRTSTYAGVPGTRGFLDGDGTAALFSNPASMGVDSTTGTLFVLDNETKIRMLTLAHNGLRTFVNVVTLVQGACRTHAAFSYYNIIFREVWCQTGWQASLIPAENVTAWTWDTFCLGNILTCQN